MAGDLGVVWGDGWRHQQGRHPRSHLAFLDLSSALAGGSRGDQMAGLGPL